MSVFIPIPKKSNAKECSNYCTIALISQASKVMFKILQARLQPTELGNSSFRVISSCLFDDPVDVGNLISYSFASSKPSLYIWNFSVHIQLKPSLKDFENNLASMSDECNCDIV